MKQRDNRQLSLTVSLIPRPNWGKDLAKLLPRRDWEQLRRRVYAEADHCCAICGVTGALHADEVWDYDEENVIQKLTAIRAICPDCHACKHWGRTSRVSPPVELERLAAHFCRVNNCDLTVFKAHLTKAGNDWRRRSALAGWRIDFGEWAPLMGHAPAPMSEPSHRSPASPPVGDSVITDDIQIPLRVPGEQGKEEARKFFAQYHPDEWFMHLSEWERWCGTVVGYTQIHLLFTEGELCQLHSK